MRCLRYIFVWLTVALAITAAPSAHAAATLIVQNGVLLGADNVLIGGQSFSVRFEHGTCNQVYGPVYSNCEAMSSYPVVQGNASWVTALTTQVFVDGPQGNFNSNPASTVAYCCSWTVPLGFFPRDGEWAFYTLIHGGANTGYPDNYGYAIDTYFASPAAAITYFNTHVDNWIVFTVPEPASGLMLGIGAAVVAVLGRSRATR